MREYSIDNVPDASYYADGLNSLGERLTPLRRDIITAHYYAPDRRVTAPQLAVLAGITGGYPVVNAQYGGLGRVFCETTGFDPQLRPDGTPRWWAVWSKGYSHPDGFIWQMHDPVARALEVLEWVTDDGSVRLPEELPEQYTFTEGSAIQVTVNCYERNRNARKACLTHYGYNCVVCGFDFSAVYGALGNDYIHVHHVVPLSEIGKSYVIDPVADLRPVCPNCHAMLHRKTPALQIVELQRLLQSGGLAQST